MTNDLLLGSGTWGRCNPRKWLGFRLAPTTYTRRSVVASLVRGGLIAGFSLAFLTSFEELTTALFRGGGLLQRRADREDDD
jgi:hypothetical protein